MRDGALAREKQDRGVFPALTSAFRIFIFSQKNVIDHLLHARYCASCEKQSWEQACAVQWEGRTTNRTLKVCHVVPTYSTYEKQRFSEGT